MRLNTVQEWLGRIYDLGVGHRVEGASHFLSLVWHAARRRQPT